MDARQALDPEAAGQQVRDALGVVRDPELQRAVTELGFVGGVSIDGTRVHVYLRLPAYFGATDLAWLVVADARAAVAALPWVDSVEVCLRGDHGVHHPHRPGDMPGTPSDGAAGLDDDQRQVCRIAFHARHLELIRGLLEHGVGRAELGGLSIRDLRMSPETAVYLQRRGALGLRVDPDAALVVTESGDGVTDIDGYLAQLRALTSGERGRGSWRGPLQAGRHRSVERF
jgi:metal-sulfur cluster biosynthetic enzyme